MDVETAIGIVSEGVSEFRLGRKMSIAGALKAGEGLVSIRQGIKHGEFAPYLDRWELPSSTANDWMKLFRSGYTVVQIVDLGGIRATLESIRQYQPQLPDAPQISDGRTFDEPPITDTDIEEQAKAIRAVPSPNPPTPLERAEAKISLLEIENLEQANRLNELGRQLKMALAEQGDALQPKLAVLQEREATIHALQSSVGEWQVKYGDLKRAHDGAIRRLREMEGK